MPNHATREHTGVRARITLLLAALLHAAAFWLMQTTETTLAAKGAYLLAWGLLNGLLLAVTRRPVVSATLALALIVALIQLSRLKHSIVFMTIVFFDVLVIDPDSVRFLFATLPRVKWAAWIALPALAALVWALWRLDPFRLGRARATFGAIACLVGLSWIALAIPTRASEIFYNGDYVSKFFRSGVVATVALARHGMFEADATVAARLAAPTACKPSGRLPHILLIHDESSFDARALPGLKVPPGYGAHFRSFDGAARKLMVESSGGASWYAEYNVLTGLSSRSFGAFSYFLTRIASGRVERGLPRALANCGYDTWAFYPSPGGFMGARGFQTTTGIANFRDQRALGGRMVEADAFYYDAALGVLRESKRDKPVFAFVYLAANHFPWTKPAPAEPDVDATWRPPGNAGEIDEYLRRQTVSALHLQRLRTTLARDFPTEPFLIVRYGDHQPSFASSLLAPTISDADWAEALLRFDPRFFATYYAIDTVNFMPADMSAAMGTLDAAYLPLVILGAAGVPLPPDFAAQRAILSRCSGVFYGCQGGAEARRFNRLLIDAGLIKRL